MAMRIPQAAPTDDRVRPVPRDINVYDYIKKWENPHDKGRRKDGLWETHESPEGGLDTLGNGHKLTEDEARTGIIKIGNRFVKFNRRGLRRIKNKKGKLVWQQFDIPPGNRPGEEGSADDPPVGLSDGDVRELQEQDMKPRIDWVNQFTRLTNNEKTMLVSLTYNSGIKGFTHPWRNRKGHKKQLDKANTFKALERYQNTGNREDWLEFMEGTQTYIKSAGKISKGLVNRRADERRVALTRDAPAAPEQPDTPDQDTQPRPFFGDLGSL